MLKKAIRTYFYKMAKVHLNRSNYSNELEYYRDVTFIKSIIIIHPFTIIPVFLGIHYGYNIGSFPIVFLASLTYGILWIITIPSRLTVFHRKLILTIGIYNFGFQLLISTGMDASGILYWTIGNIMGSLFFKRINYLIIVLLNIFMAVVMGSIIYFNYKTPLFSSSLTLPDWILIAINNIFLSITISVLFTELINSLHRAIFKQRQIKSDFLENNLLMSETNKLLNQKNKELEQMAYVTSHDLQEPLRMISSFTIRIKDKYNAYLDSKTKYLLVNSLENVNRMKITITDLLEFSTMSFENKAKEKINVEKLIHQLLIKNKMNHIPQVTVLCNDEIHAYFKPISKILDNFIINSNKKHAPDTPLELIVSCKKENGYYQFTYSDDNLYLNALNNEIQQVALLFENDHFFESFHQDILISKLLIEQLDGEIWLELIDQKIVIYFKIPNSL